VAFNGTDFVVVCSTGSKVIARLVNPTTGEVRREKPIQTSVVYPWGKPITIEIAQADNIAYWNRISSAGDKRCLVNWNFTASPGLGELWGALVEFSGQGWTCGSPQKLSAKSEAPYGYCETAANGTGGYFLAWHDMSEADKKKVHPYDPWEADLFTSTQQIAGTSSLTLTSKSWGAFYTKKKNPGYCPRVDYGGLNYAVIWNCGGTDVKLEWLKEKLATTWEYESPDFWAKVDPGAKEEAKKLLDCMNDFGLLGAYISPTGSLVEVFGLMSLDIPSSDWGLIFGGYDSCFGKNEGLLVYYWLNQNKCNPKYPYRAIRGRFITKPNFTKPKFVKVGNLEKLPLSLDLLLGPIKPIK
jgi:hypothetical protein